MIYYYYPLENTLMRYATHHAKPLDVKTISVTVSHGKLHMFQANKGLVRSNMLRDSHKRIYRGEIIL